ncbi:hypothetical protein CBM2629_B40056 [Cupriavidus taiwanensis]|nr:hypothetical protein CBM2629_B40056 [Cupriavidus taiwanensis]
MPRATGLPSPAGQPETTRHDTIDRPPAAARPFARGARAGRSHPGHAGRLRRHADSAAGRGQRCRCRGRRAAVAARASRRGRRL